MTYFCKLESNLSLFPNTTSEYYDTYKVYGTGFGKTPLNSYQNAVVASAKLYELDLNNYILNKKYPNLQIESSVQSTIRYLEETPEETTPVPPTNMFFFSNSIKNTVIVRNQNDSTSQYTDTGTSTYSCIFETYYYALDPCNINDNTDISSLYVNSNITSATN